MCSKFYRCPTCQKYLEVGHTLDDAGHLGKYLYCENNHRWQEPVIDLKPYVAPAKPTPRGTMIAKATRMLFSNMLGYSRKQLRDEATALVQDILAIAADPREKLPMTYEELVEEVKAGRKPLP